MRTPCILLLLLISATAFGQEPAQTPPVLELPESDIFLFELGNQDGKLTVSNGRNITPRKGYDNQPWFTPDSSSILFSANHKPDRTDVFEYTIKSQKTTQVTDSPAQEYSPQISPDNKTISFVTDGDTANQSIWSVNRDGSKPNWLLKNQGEREPVGYYSWNHKTGYILFWSRYGFSMRLVHGDKEVSHYVTGNAVPSSPHIIPKTENFSFMHRQGNGEIWIKELNPTTLAIRPLTPVIGNARHYGWTPDGAIVMCDGTKLHRWTPDAKDGWESVADLADHNMQGVTRVAVSPNGKYLAVVGLPKAAEQAE